MLARSAVRAFQQRKRRSFDWIKRLPKAELQAEANQILPPLHLHTVPWIHQLACLLIGVNRKQFLFLLDVGLGKTKVILDTFHNRSFSGEVTRLLVVVPNRVNIGTWREQLRIHQPNLRGLSWTGTPTEREKKLKRRWDVLVMTRAALMHATCKKALKGRKQKSGWVVDKKKATAFLSQFQMVCHDEIHDLANPRSVGFKIAKFMIKLIEYRYGLTGTPTGRDQGDLWGQFYVIDKGLTLGESQALYRETFFRQKKNWWTGFPEFKFIKEKAPLLNKYLQNRSIYYEEKECMDLPPLIIKPVRIHLPKDIDAQYDAMVERIRESRGDKHVVRNSYIKMRQLTSGFMTVKDDEGNKSYIEFPENPKLDWIMDKIEEIGPRYKVVIFHQFVWSGKRICHELEKRGFGYLALRGKSKNPEKFERQFTRHKKYRVGVVQLQSGGTGTNLQAANYGFYYELPDSFKRYRQSRKRIHRGGQTRRTFIFEPVMIGTVDETIRANLKQGKSLHNAVIAGKYKQLLRRKKGERRV